MSDPAEARLRDPWQTLAEDVWSELPPSATREETVAMYARVLQEEYECGKLHGDHDRRAIEQQNREQGREISDLKGKSARVKMEAMAIADALGARGLIDFADDVRMLTKL